ncbi:50S ribosomal protein L24 [Planctomycetota bacterium]
MKVKGHLKVHRDDLVEVISGEEKGKRGKIMSVHPESSAVVVEGVNYRWKHLRRSQQNPQGGRVERESPIHVSNVMLVSEETDTPQRVRAVAFQIETASGAKKTLRYRVGARDGKPIAARDIERAEKHEATKE